MIFRSIFVTLACTLILAQSTIAANIIDFEAEPLGTIYGTTAGTSPGDVVVIQDDIKMTVENFTLGAFTEFNEATIVQPPQSFFPAASNPTQALNANNINAKFDLLSVGYDVDFLSIRYVDVGGDENFEINSLGRQEVGSLSSLTPVPGFNVNVTSNPVTGGVEGVVEIYAAAGNRIEQLLIGGQEFAIDDLKVVPEPSGLMIIALGCIAMSLGRLRRR